MSALPLHHSVDRANSRAERLGGGTMLLAAEVFQISDSLSVGAAQTSPPSKQVKGERSESGNGLSVAREYKERPFTAQSGAYR